MIMGTSAPFVSAFIDAVDDAIRAHQPHHGMSAMQRAWLAFCVTAVVVTNSICWARFERASLGTYSLAALSWMFHHSKEYVRDTCRKWSQGTSALKTRCCSGAILCQLQL